MVDAARLLGELMRLAESQAEDWKREHDDAEDCYSVEFLLRTYLHFLGQLGNLDNRVRYLELEGKAETEAENTIAQQYQLWFKVAQAILMPALISMENKGFRVERAEEFRNAYQEVKGILTPDNEFFDSEPLAELRDQAIDAHRHGETEEWEVPVS